MLPQTLAGAHHGKPYTWEHKRAGQHRINYVLWPICWSGVGLTSRVDYGCDISSGALDHHPVFAQSIVKGRSTAKPSRWRAVE